ncbi:hypothetical protein HYT26_03695 [Candidatus Pacearchaeota archaeon]|nr:hypothetical protein [Candidatus Pacearchaeota archaeon]
MIEIQKLEDITSKEYLDKALEAAKTWCRVNLSKHIQNFQDKFDYKIFNYAVDNKMVGPDMCLDKQNNGLIRVSTRKLKWYIEREKHFKDYRMIRYAKIADKNIKIEGYVEIDPESMFVHEITEFIVSKIPEIFFFYFSKMEFPHFLAYQIENINRKERGLKIWPYSQ